VRLLLDMNLSPVLVDDLSDEGVDAIHWLHVGPANTDDSAILDWSAREGTILVSTDKDFGMLLAENKLRSPSVILIRDDNVHPRVIRPLLVDLLARFESELRAGAIISTRSGLHRVATLPLQ
jgi:predicted nuclease of predicted toxin-antitoxin system